MGAHALFDMFYARCVAHRVNLIMPAEITWEWEQACEHVLILCEDAQIDPRLYVESVVQTVGWFCRKQGLPLLPRQVIGAGAADRYNKWLERARRRVASASASKIESLSRDRIMEGETAYVEIFAVTMGLPAKDRHRCATLAARQVFPRWRTCPLRRVCALTTHFHQLDSRLPDIIVLDHHWKTADVFTVVERML